MSAKKAGRRRRESNESDLPQYEIRRDTAGRLIVYYESNINIDAHFHNCIEIIYLDSGRLRFSVHDEYYELTEAQLMAVSSMTPHSLDSNFFGETTHVFIVLIPRKYLREYDKLLNENSFAIPFMSDDDGIIRGLLNLLFDFNPYSNKPKSKRTSFADFGGSTDRRESALRHLCSLLISLIITKCGLTPKTRSSAVITGAVEFIESNFRNNILVSEIAKTLFINQHDLSTQFNQAMGVSITEYISLLRTDEAARLLVSDPNLSVDMVRKLSGFGSSRSFFRDFRRSHGCTPTEYRKKITALDLAADIGVN